MLKDAPQAVIARFAGGEPGAETILFDAVHDEKFRSAIFRLIAQQKSGARRRRADFRLPGRRAAGGGESRPLPPAC